MAYFSRPTVEREDQAIIERGWWIERLPDSWQIWVWQRGMYGCIGKWITYGEPFCHYDMAELEVETEIEGG